MLTPKELESLPQSVTELYEQLEEDIIADMARRIVKTDFATDTAQWQLIQLQRMSAAHDEVFKKLSKLTNKTEKELVKLFNDAAQKSFDRDSDTYSKAGYETVPLSENRQLQKIIAAGLEKTNGLFENLTKTTANTASRQFENALDRAYMQVVSGAFDYNTAVRTAIKDLAQKGVASITYPGGHTDYLDVAVRRAVLTGVSQTTGKMQEQMADDAGCDLVETTAHNGARPEHAQWQGKVFSRSGTSKKYPDFKSSTGYGTGAGLKGWNCRHDFFPYFEDMPRAYSDEKLQWLNNREVEYNGVKMTEYEASQKQRAMERRIRASKRELAGYDAGIKASDSESLKEELQTAFNRKSVVLKRQEAALKDFCNQTGLRRDRAREQVSAHFNSDKGKTVAFDKSVSQKAVWADKTVEKEAEKIYNLGSSEENLKAYLRDERTRAYIRSDKVNKAIAEGKQGKHIKGHNNYIPGRSYLTVSMEELQKIVDEYAGTGSPQRDGKNRWIHKEHIQLNRVIGVNINNITNEETPTSQIMIHYSKNGVHIVPTLRR